MMAIETHLRQRKDVSGKVSTRQAVKLAWFQREQDKLLRAKKLKWYILDPQSIQVQMWDALPAIALIFTAIVTPLEVAFLPAPTCAHEGLFIVNRLVDGIFVVDMIMQVRSPHPPARTRARHGDSRLHLKKGRRIRA